MHILNPLPVCPSNPDVFQASLTKAQRYKIKNSPRRYLFHSLSLNIKSSPPASFASFVQAAIVLYFGELLEQDP